LYLASIDKSLQINFQYPSLPLQSFGKFLGNTCWIFNLNVNTILDREREKEKGRERERERRCNSDRQQQKNCGKCRIQCLSKKTHFEENPMLNNINYP
jgi:hypothetical protein